MYFKTIISCSVLLFLFKVFPLACTFHIIKNHNNQQQDLSPPTNYINNNNTLGEQSNKQHSLTSTPAPILFRQQDDSRHKIAQEDSNGASGIGEVAEIANNPTENHRVPSSTTSHQQPPVSQLIGFIDHSINEVSINIKNPSELMINFYLLMNEIYMALMRRSLR